MQRRVGCFLHKEDRECIRHTRCSPHNHTLHRQRRHNNMHRMGCTLIISQTINLLRGVVPLCDIAALCPHQLVSL